MLLIDNKILLIEKNITVYWQKKVGIKKLFHTFKYFFQSTTSFFAK